MKSEDINKLGVIVLSFSLLIFIYMNSYGERCFGVFGLLAAYLVLLYDIVSQIYFIVK